MSHTQIYTSKTTCSSSKAEICTDTLKHRKQARRMKPHEVQASSSQQAARCGQSSPPHIPLVKPPLEHLSRLKIPQSKCSVSEKTPGFGCITIISTINIILPLLLSIHGCYSAMRTCVPTQPLNLTTKPGVPQGQRHCQ